MMNQQPDDFFREKLESFHKPAPAGAWDRIESRLKKNTAYDWRWKIAASLLLLAATTYLFLPRPKNSIQQPLAQTETEGSIPESLPDVTMPQEVPGKNSKKRDAISLKKPSLAAKKVSAEKSAVQKINSSPVEKSEQSTLEKKDDSNGETPRSESVVPVTKNIVESVATKNITLKFSAEETHAYLDKNAIAEATSTERKSSTFKKLLKKANDLKSNQDHFGDLREKKNEILALNFRNEKRGQNK